MAGMTEKDYGLKNNMGPMDAAVSPAANAQQEDFRRTSSPPSSLKAKAAGTADTESLNSDITLAAQEEGIDPAFYAKVQVLNRSLAEIGMGRYQWELFFSGGFGWFADNICEYFDAGQLAVQLCSTAKEHVCCVVCAIRRLPLAPWLCAIASDMWGMWGIAINGAVSRSMWSMSGGSNHTSVITLCDPRPQSPSRPHANRTRVSPHCLCIPRFLVSRGHPTCRAGTARWHPPHDRVACVATETSQHEQRIVS